MRKHGGTPSRRDKHVTLAAISPPGVARGRFVGGQQSGLAGSKPPPLFTREASSCSSQGRRQGEPWGASPRPSAPTYLPTSKLKLPLIRRLKACMESKSNIHGGYRPKVNAHVHPHFTLETPSDMGATHCPSQPMILRPILVILRAPSQMEYAIRHMVVFNSKAYANI